MTAKWHVRADGSMGPCNAREGNCPFGDEEGTRHFDNETEARSYSEKMVKERHADRRHLLRRRKSNNDKLVIGVASSAVLDLSESDKVFREEGVEAYERYQVRHMDEPLGPGVAAPFVRKLLKFNKVLDKVDPGNSVDVIIASRNSPRTGLRAMKSLQKLDIPIDKATFTSGKSPAPYMEEAYDVDLFLSANREDIHEAARHDLPAGRVVQDNEVMPGADPHPNELRLAFDFDGIIAGDSSESQFQDYVKSKGSFQDALNAYAEYEQEHAEDPIESGPLMGLLRGFNRVQGTMDAIRNGTHPALEKMTDEERAEIERDMKDVPSVRIYLVTARGTDTAERALNTLDAHGVHVDEMSMLAGRDKTPTLEVIQPDMFFDDQAKNIKSYSSAPSVHIPLGVCNPCINKDIKDVFDQNKGNKNRISK